jgi:RNA polymerase sigma factor (TIGR02999 family)
MSELAASMLQRWRDRDPAAVAAIDEQVYAQLKRLARSQLANGGTPTLNATALVHEAVLRLLGGGSDPESRAHLLALAALKMRAVLVDHLRAGSALKRGEGIGAITLGAAEHVSAADDREFLDLHVALDALAALDARAASAIEHSYFGGMSAQESALALGVSVATVERDLAFGRAYLKTRLRG